MISDNINDVLQNERDLYPNYRQEQIINSLNIPNIIMNSSQTNKKNNFPQFPLMNPIKSGNNSVNIISSQISQIQIQNNDISYDPAIVQNPNIQNASIINIGNNIINKYSIIKNRENIAMNEHPPIPMKLCVQAMKSICKISYFYNNEPRIGIGFFMKYSDSLKLLITNYHFIFPKLMNNKIEIEIWNNKKMILNLIGRYIKFLEKPKDIIAIEIKSIDEIYKHIEFLNYDLNYDHFGYDIYKNKFIFSFEFPFGPDVAAASGKIIDINKSQFEHNLNLDNGATGSPLILLDLMMVIGIQNKKDDNKVNRGIFIGELINDIKGELESKNNNYIIGEIYIKDFDVNKKIRIINSYEEVKRNNNWMKFDKKLKNEEEIKDCEIEINNKLIPFNYFNEFKEKGKYLIKYKFKNYLIKTTYMFYECKSFTNLNLSNFNTQNITNMLGMFSGCETLTNLNLSNFNTKNVINFFGLFWGCKSLTNLNLSNFNTENITNMQFMFCECKSLTSLNLSNFNTKNVINMQFMFSGCGLLTNLDLSNFNTQNVTKMHFMFDDCKSLKKENVITNDSKIIEELNKIKNM